MPRLVVEKGQDKGRTISLSPKGTLLIGRDSSASVQLRDTMCSRMHFKIEYREDTYWIIDLDSMNGTQVNGQAVREQKLAYGDLIKVGETAFSFLSDDASAGTLAGQRVGGYRIIERVGRGGMGTVYKAEQIDLQRIVALKVISEENSKDKEFVDLFIHEARAAAKLNHPNLVQVYDVKRTNDVYYFSMEFVGAGSVQDLLNKSRKVPLDRALAMILDAAKGLDYAHKKGIIHRDIKPDNLMISEDGQIKIGDMGLARTLGEKIGPSEENCVIGTPHYIAPEQVLGKEADYRSDIYALGATTYRMIAGQTPFQGASIRDLVNKKVREDPKPLHEVDPEIPRRASDLVQKMMTRDPQTRYQTMQEVIAEVEKAQREMAGLPVEGKEGSATGPIAVGNKKLLVAAVGLLIVVLVGGIIGTAFVIKKKGKPRPPPEEKGPDEKQAGDRLTAAKLFARTEMDKSQPESLRQGIKEYQDVINDFPGTTYAEEAGKFKAELEKALKERLAAIRLDEIEKDDKKNFEQLTQSFQSDRLDLSFADETVKLYTTFTEAADFKGTAAAEEAKERCTHILEWKRRVEARQEAYRQKIAPAKTAANQGKFKEAWKIWDDFKTETLNAALECKFSKNGRWCYLLFDGPAGERAGEVINLAKADFVKIREQCDDLKSQAKFEDAMSLLDPIIKDSIEQVSADARALWNRLAEDKAAWNAEKDRKEREAALALEKREHDLFAGASEEARKHVLKYEFSKANAKLREIRSDLQTAAMGKRVDKRMEEISRAFSLKDGLAQALKDGHFRKDFKNDRKGIGGTITEFNESDIIIKLDIGGTYHFSYTDFLPREFYQFVRLGWIKMAPLDQCNLASLCMEFGLYEDALIEMEGIIKSPEYSKDQVLKDFCDDYKKLISDGRYTEYEEIEAQKRLTRLKSFVDATPPDIEAAKREVDIIRREYGKTKFVADNQKMLDDALQRINEKSSDDQKKKMKSQGAKEIDEYHAAAIREARKRNEEIVARLGRLDQEFERCVQLGEVYAAMGDWSAATEKWGRAKELNEKSPASRGGSAWQIMGSVYAGLFRSALMQKNKTLENQILKDGNARFNGRGEAEMWAQITGNLQAWAQKRPSSGTLERLKSEVTDNPDDPNRVWALAEAYGNDALDLLNARGYYAWLLENHPGFDMVRSGECLYRLAEIQYKCREVREALGLYQKLGEEHPEFRRLKDEKSEESVQRRIDSCYRLMSMMGYRPEKKD